MYTWNAAYISNCQTLKNIVILGKVWKGWRYHMVHAEKLSYSNEQW